MKKLIFSLIAVALVVIGIYAYINYRENELYRIEGIVSGNGRLEATEVGIATKLAGRIESILVDEGELVQKGQLLAKMQTNTLEAELEQAKARKNQAVTELAGAEAKLEVCKSETEAAKAQLMQAQSRLSGAEKRYERAKLLVEKGAVSRQNFETDETNYQSAQAEVATASAGVKKAEASITSAQAATDGAKANIKAAQADIKRIQADIDDSNLVAPLNGRIQYRVAEPGEVLSAGGNVLNLVDLTDVYMTFFLPEEIAGKVAIGADVRLVLDALPNIPIPAKVSFVASVAQFTPKTVETRVERQKMMFRVKAKIDPALLSKYIEYVKTGVPGVAWVKIDPAIEWPDALKTKSEK